MNSYLLFKSLHLIAVVSWMAGLLYLPRIFVYHVENKEKKEVTDIFYVMEKRLFLYSIFYLFVTFLLLLVEHFSKFFLPSYLVMIEDLLWI